VVFGTVQTAWYFLFVLIFILYNYI
jgi:hypothetical protein